MNTEKYQISPKAFNSIHQRLLTAASNPSSSSSSLKEKKKFNAIEAAQLKSSLYDTTKMTVDSMKKEKIKMKPSAGKGWFDLQPLEMTPKLQQDVKMIQLRNYMDPKRFYKNPDKVGPVLHVGTVIEGNGEYKSARLTRKERKQSITQEILSDEAITGYAKRKTKEIQTERSKKRKMYKPNMKEKSAEKRRKKIKKLY